MRGKVKLSKRQIKEDKFTAFMLNTKQQFLDNWQFYVIGVVTVILIVVAAVYYVNSENAKRQEAAERYARAVYDYRNGQNEVAILSLNQILEDYSGGNSAEQATFLLGKINFDLKNYAEATRYFEMYLDEYKNNKLNRAASFAGIAACSESQGDFATAAEKFALASDEYADGPLQGDYEMAAMRNYLEVGDVQKAQDHLEIIKSKFAGTELERRSIRLFAEKSQS